MLNVGSGARYFYVMNPLRLPRPALAVVDVWAVSLRGPVEADEVLLGPEEQVRMGRRRGHERRRFARSHGALRRVVAAYMGQAPSAVSVDAPYGSAPLAVGLQLSLTHCEDIALVAVSSSPVGVDIEALAVAGEPSHAADLAAMTLSARELEQFGTIDARSRPAAWVRAFTRKEACLKAAGLGLSDVPLAQFDVLDDRTAERTLVDLALGDGLVGAVALRHPSATVRWKELSL